MVVGNLSQLVLTLCIGRAVYCQVSQKLSQNSCVMDAEALSGRGRSAYSVGSAPNVPYSGSKYLQLVFIVT